MSDFEEYPNAIQIGDTLYKSLPPDLFVFIQEQIARAEQAEADLAKCRAFIKHLEEECNCTDDYSEAFWKWKDANDDGGSNE